MNKAKVGYPSKDTAEAAIAGQSGMNAYPCTTCGQWHVGHRTPWWRRTREGRRLQRKIRAALRGGRD
jgi:hypothetical protein